MINDVVGLVGELTNLIKACELEKATHLAASAMRQLRASNLDSRQASVHQVTISLVELRRQRERLHDVVATLPESEKLLAQTQIERICRDLFDNEIAALQSRKRQLSCPAR